MAVGWLLTAATMIKRMVGVIVIAVTAIQPHLHNGHLVDRSISQIARQRGLQALLLFGQASQGMAGILTGTEMVSVASDRTRLNPGS